MFGTLHGGFACHHPGLMQAVSDGYPLHKRAGEGVEWLLDPGTRIAPGRMPTPMCFMLGSLARLTSLLRMTAARQQLIVNAPSSVSDPVSERVLQTLVNDLAMTSSSAKETSRNARSNSPPEVAMRH